MSITIDLTNQELTDIKQITKLEDDAEAVGKAVREFLRLSRLRDLKAVSGKVEWDDTWQELEALELSETNFPQ
jgi:Arc/MetJ family transcription regulator